MCKPLTLDQLDYVPGTIVFDMIVDYMIAQGESRAWALQGALIFGVIWRYERMDDRRCHASQTTIAANAYCSVRHFRRIRDRLVALNLIIDHNPGLRNKPHNCTISDFSRVLIEQALNPDSSDSESHHSSDSESHRSSDSESDEKRRRRGELINQLEEKIDLESLLLGFDPDTVHLLQLKKWVNDPDLPNEWIDQAISVTIARRADKPFSYLSTVIRDYIAKGGPAGSEPAPGIAGEITPADGQQADRAVLISEVYKSCNKSALFGEIEKWLKSKDQRQALLETIAKLIKEAVNDGRFADWEANWPRDHIVTTLADHAVTEFYHKRKASSSR